jgi:trimethylamine--corrinoid protein Co-methyltransferase
MQSDYTVLRTPQFRVLSDDQLEKIHLASLEILRRTGVEMLAEEARELLKSKGAHLVGTRVRIPAHLIEWAIRVAPSRVVLCDRDGNPALHLENNMCYYGTGSDTRYIIDPHSGERRVTFKRDVADMARIVDYLPNIDFVMSMGIASDVSGDISDLHHFDAMVSNTRKPIVFTTWSPHNLKDIVNMAESVAGGQEALRSKPFAALYAEPISPLVFESVGVEKVLYIADKGLPLVYKPAVLGGASGPITYAGQLALCNAEALTGLLLAQLKREGTPVVYGGGFTPLDMRTVVAAPCSPEHLILNTARAELANYYELPIFSYAGDSSSKVCDEQAAIEAAMSILVAALNGSNLVHDVGYLDSHLTSSFDQLVMCDEIISMVKRMMEGIQVDTENLALDLIDQVGPGGHFLAEDHTLRHFKQNWYPELMDRSKHESWLEKGGKRLGEVVNEKVREILATYEPDPLGDKVKAELATIIEEAEKKRRRNDNP